MNSSNVPTPRTVGARIALARRELGAREARDILPPELAKRVGVSAPTAYGWENGTKLPKRANIGLLSDILGVTPWWLEHGRDPKHPETTGRQSDTNWIGDDLEGVERAEPEMTAEEIGLVPKKKKAAKKGGQKKGR